MAPLPPPCCHPPIRSPTPLPLLPCPSPSPSPPSPQVCAYSPAHGAKAEALYDRLLAEGLDVDIFMYLHLITALGSGAMQTACGWLLAFGSADWCLIAGAAPVGALDAD